MQQVKTDSRNAVKMGPGTLYGSLDRMIAAGLVAKSDTRDPCRIYYKLTALGQAAWSTPGHPALHVFGGFLLGMLSMYIATRVYSSKRNHPTA